MKDRSLRDQLRSVEKYESLSIFMTFKPHGWARFDIDGKIGSLSIQSDWGNWQYVWGGGPATWGYPTFLDFLKRGNYHYLTDKLHYGGRKRTVIDEDATRKAMVRRIAQARLGRLKFDPRTGRYVRTDQITSERARELREGVEEFVTSIGGKPWDSSIWEEFRRIEEESYCSDFRDFFYDAHELIEQKDHPRLVFLRDQLLPMLVAYLRGEIRVEDK